VEAVLNFTEHVILNTARLWTGLSSDQKQRLQKVLFTQGVTFENGNYRTTETCLFFKMIPKSEAEKKLGDPIGNRTRATAVKGQCPNR
jgi:hypothetical protein